jgi:hypothetical protein
MDPVHLLLFNMVPDRWLLLHIVPHRLLLIPDRLLLMNTEEKDPDPPPSF